MTDLPPPPPPAPPGRGARRLRIALGISLALNLAVAGVVGGALLRDNDRFQRPAQVRNLGFGPFSGALGPEDRRELRRAFMAAAPDMRGTRSAMRGDMAAMATLLRQEPLDGDALRALLDRQNRRSADFQALGQDLMFRHIAAMTPEARRGFADRLEASLSRRNGPPGQGGAGQP